MFARARRRAARGAICAQCAARVRQQRADEIIDGACPTMIDDITLIAADAARLRRAAPRCRFLHPIPSTPPARLLSHSSPSTRPRPPNACPTRYDDAADAEAPLLLYLINGSAAYAADAPCCMLRAMLMLMP